MQHAQSNSRAEAAGNREGETAALREACGRNEPTQAVGSVTEEMSTDQDLRLIRFNVLRNALYHTARRRYLERTNRLFSFLVVVLGTAAASDVLARFGIDPVLPAILIAIVGALQLVIDFGGQARTHQALQRDYFALLSEIDTQIDPSAQQIAAWQGRQMRIAADEPPVLRAIDAKAYNDAIAASTDFGEGERLIIPHYQRLVAGLFSFEGYAYRKICEGPHH